MNHTDLLALEGKINQIDLGFEVGIIERSGTGLHCLASAAFAI